MVFKKKKIKISICISTDISHKCCYLPIFYLNKSSHTLCFINKWQQNVPNTKEATTHDQMKQVVTSGWTLWLYKKGGWARRRTDGQPVKVSVLKSFISRRKISCLMNNAAHDRWLPSQGWLQSRLHAPKLIITPIVLFFRTICKPWTPVLLREREKVIISPLFLLLCCTLPNIQLDRIPRII